jgi:thiamine biosynthesis lipoprotein
MSQVEDEWPREARLAMGTRWEIVLPGTDRVRLTAAAEAVLDEVERLEVQLSRFRPESDISGINATAWQEPVRVEPRLFELLRLAQEVNRATDGAFDLTVGPLLRAWGFVGKGGALPDPEELERARAVVGADLIDLDEENLTIRFRCEGVSLDLGAIGKGCAIDRARELLEDAGVTSALIHGGTSTAFGMGTPPGAPSWRVALRNPRGGERDICGEVLLTDRALSVSAPHNKAFQVGDRRYGHVLDPRTGEPTQGALLAAVAHESATLTDALSTALLVLGAEGLATVAAAYPEADLLVAEETPEGVWLHAAGPDRWRLKVGD